MTTTKPKARPSGDDQASTEDLRARAVAALRDGRIDLAEDLLAGGDVSLAALVENLRVYQAELEIQNEELRRSEDEAERALARFTALFSTLPVAGLVADRHGLILEANAEARDLFALRNISAHSYFLFRLVQERHRSAIVDLWQRLAQGEMQAGELREIRLRGSDGSDFTGDLHIARLPGSPDSDVQFICAALDRTEAVRQREALLDAYERLEQSQEAYRVLAEHSPAWDYWVDPDGRFVHVSPGCREVTGHEPRDFIDDPALLERLILPDDRSRWRRHVHCECGPDDYDQGVLTLRLTAADGSLRWIEHTCRPVIDENGRFLGRRGVNRDITRRHRAEDSLSELRSMLVEAERIANVGAWAWHRADNLLHVSPQWQRIHGSSRHSLTPAELIDEHVHPDDAARIRAAWEAAVAGEGPFDIRHRVRRGAAGEERIVHTRAEPVHNDDDDGLPGQLNGAALDITRQVESEHALRESEARFRSVFDTAPVGIAVLDPEGRPVMANAALERFLGYSANELACMTYADYTHPDELAADHAGFQSLLTGKQRLYSRDKRYVRKDGETVWGRVTVALIRNDDAGSHAVAMIADIGERIAAERALRESERKYRTLFESAAQGLCILQDGRFVSVNQAALRLLGHADHAGAVLDHRPEDISPEHQPDGGRSADKARGLLARAMDGVTERFEWEHLHADGHTISLEITLNRVELWGAPAVFATWYDLSPERAARQREKRARTVFENTSEGIIVTDTEQRILAVNPAFTEITGYDEPEVLGETPRLLKSGRHDNAFYQSMWASLKETGRWRGEFWNRRKNGEVYPQLSTITTVYDDSGELTNYIGVFGDITHVKRSEEALYRLAHHDALTSLPNRTLLRARLEQSIARARRDGRMLALLFLDLDMFKNVNDSLGHPVGDALLQRVAEAMEAQIRAADSIARLGGDEFVVLMEDIEDPNAAATLARRLLGTLANPFKVQSRELYITASIGISIYPVDGTDMDTLLSNADVAMYQAKDQGRNTYRFFEPAMTEGALERLRLENALRGALARGELRLEYQPQFRLDDGCMHGVEVLARWQHPEFGEVSPGRFIPIAEESGMIVELGSWVLEAACRQLAAWDEAGFLVPRLAVNLSMQQLERRDLTDQVIAALRRTGVEPDRLELEVTETMLMRHAERVIANLEDLRALGITLAVDDFGSGFSSMIYLKRLPISRLKIDKTFIDQVTRDPADDAIARAIITLGRGLGLDVLAEGVETEEQADFLRREGCAEAQGYLFGQPMTADELVAAQFRR